MKRPGTPEVASENLPSEYFTDDLIIRLMDNEQLGEEGLELWDPNESDQAYIWHMYE